VADLVGQHVDTPRRDRTDVENVTDPMHHCVTHASDSPIGPEGAT
jgi:hypothetical protein